MKKPYVFISYSTKDADIAHLVHSYLEGNGIHCWIASQNIDGGESFAEQIVDAIDGCSAFVVMASVNSNISPHVNNETSLAFSAKKKIIPFRLQDYPLSKTNKYFLQHAQWIDAFGDMNEALKNLLRAVRTNIPTENTITSSPQTKGSNVEPSTADNITVDAEDDLPTMTREEIVAFLLDKIRKFPYCLRDRASESTYAAFKQKASLLFKNTVTMYYKGRPTAGGIDYVDMVVNTLSQGNGVSIQVKGLPGSGKNMLLQLAYYKMLDNFKSGDSNYLPIYLSSSFFEKQQYTLGNERQEMAALIQEETKEYFNFIKKNPSVRPVLMVEAVREHIVTSFSPEEILMEQCAFLGKFNRIVALDVGLVKNRMRLKRTIPLMGNSAGYTFRFRSIPISDKDACLTAIRTVLEMYSELYDSVEESNIYSALYKLHFTAIDIFNIRLVATELSLGRSVDDISLIDMYEHLALSHLPGGEEQMLSTAKELYEYIFNPRYEISKKNYSATPWSLPHMHNTYLDFIIAYYFSHCIQSAKAEGDLHFWHITMTPMGNSFMESNLQDNYPLQETLLNQALTHYEAFDISQKSTAAYWLGKLTYKSLTVKAEELLSKEHKRLKSLVKANNQQTLENRDNHYLFRSICGGLISYGKTSVLDDYLCLLVINDVANAVNRGAIVQYLGDGSVFNAHNDFYLDTDLKLGEQTIRILCSRVEAKLNSKRSGYAETDLITLLTLVQARMHTIPEKLPYNLSPYCEKCLELVNKYQKRPRSVISDKLFYYLNTVCEDLILYKENSRFDAAFTLYHKLGEMREKKKRQWITYGIEDPESIAEHTLSAWFMAMIFLPCECDEQGYNKQEILDMLLIHDMGTILLGEYSDLPIEHQKNALNNHNTALRQLFLKGSYPEVANMTYYYNVWTGYFNGQNINARIAHDIDLIQTVNSFYEYFLQNPDFFSIETVKKWLAEGTNLSTDIGYDLFDRIILHNPLYRKATDNLITKIKIGETGSAGNLT